MGATGEAAHAWLELIAVTCTVTGAFYAGWLILRAMLRRRLAPYVAGMKALTALPLLCDRVAVIHKEVLPNGGSSLRDEVTQLVIEVMGLGAVMRAYHDTDPFCGRFEADANGLMSWASLTYLRWVDRTMAEVLRLGWLACVVPADRDRVRQEWLAAIREEREFRATHKIYRTDGEVFPVSVLAIPVRANSRTGVTRWVGVMKRVCVEEGAADATH